MLIGLRYLTLTVLPGVILDLNRHQGLRQFPDDPNRQQCATALISQGNTYHVEHSKTGHYRPPPHTHDRRICAAQGSIKKRRQACLLRKGILLQGQKVQEVRKVRPLQDR